MRSFLVGVGIGFAGFALCRVAVAQEETVLNADGTTAEKAANRAKKYEELKKSKNRAIKALADRYDVLVGVQEWVDASGKHKINARYVEHDPELKWVKLSVATGSGDKRVVKESTIQMAKLNKTSQSKVVQIDKLQKKLDELSADEDVDPTGSLEAGRGEEDARGDGSGRRRRYDRETPDGASGQRSDAGSDVDRTQWATDYDAFRANFTIREDANGQRGLDWGELRQLKAVADAATETRRPPRAEGETASAEAAPSLDGVAEIHWEAPLVNVRQVKSVGEAQFRLSPLPRQIKLRFLIDEQESYETWSQLPLNDPVRFVGRFETAKPREIVLRIRMDTMPPETVAPDETASERR